jgi:hypothetical protein
VANIQQRHAGSAKKNIYVARDKGMFDASLLNDIDKNVVTCGRQNKKPFNVVAMSFNFSLPWEQMTVYQSLHNKKDPFISD